MPNRVIIGVCAICGKEIEKGKATAIQQKEGLWTCGFSCIGKYNNEKKKWTPEKWNALRQRQAEYDHLIQTGEASRRAEIAELEELPDEAKALVGNEQVLGIITGLSAGIQMFKKFRKKIIATESRIIFFDPKMIGIAHAEVPYAQLTRVQYKKPKAIQGTLIATTQSGDMKMDIDTEAHEAAIDLMKALQEKIGNIAGVPISIAYDKGLLSESWGFYAPPQLAVMAAKPMPAETKATESIPDQIKKLAELKDAGILTPEEFEAKKSELLSRM